MELGKRVVAVVVGGVMMLSSMVAVEVICATPEATPRFGVIKKQLPIIT